MALSGTLQQMGKKSRAEKRNKRSGSASSAARPTKSPIQPKPADTVPEQQPRPSITDWLPRLGGTSILLAGVSLMSAHFWVAITLVYIGAAVFAFDLWCERWFRVHLRRRLALVGTALACLAWFIYAVVLPPAPLGAIVLVRPIRALEGITWAPEFTYVDVALQNSSDLDYSGIDIVLEPDVNIVHISTIPKDLPGVRLIGDATKERVDVQGLGLVKNILTNKSSGEDVRLRQVSTPSWRVRFDEIPSNTSLTIALVVAETNPAKPGGIHMVPEAAYPNVKYFKKTPTKLHVAGTYTAGDRPMEIDKTFTVGYQLDSTRNP